MASSLGGRLYAANLPSVLRFGDLGDLVSIKCKEGSWLSSARVIARLWKYEKHVRALGKSRREGYSFEIILGDVGVGIW